MEILGRTTPARLKIDKSTPVGGRVEEEREREDGEDFFLLVLWMEDSVL